MRGVGGWENWEWGPASRRGEKVARVAGKETQLRRVSVMHTHAAPQPHPHAPAVPIDTDLHCT